MKRIMSIILAITLILSFNMSVSAKMNNQSVNLTEHQEKILRAFGLSEEQITNITMQEIREILKNGEFKDLSKMGITNPPIEETLSRDLKNKLKAKGLSEQDIESLHRMGYIHQKILDLDVDTIRESLNKVDIPYSEGEYSSIINTNENLIQSIICPVCHTYNHVVPVNLIYVASVPYSGGINEYFHPDCNPLSIDSAVEAAKAVTEYTFSKVYNGNPNSPNIWFPYNLHGEWDECRKPNYLHEGIDIQSLVSTEVKSVATGKIVRVDRANNFLCIYNEDLGITVQYEHLSSIPSSIYVGSPNKIEVGQVIGYQNSNDNHIHIQVCLDFECKIIHPCEDTGHVLSCVRPYGFLWWYL